MQKGLYCLIFDGDGYISATRIESMYIGQVAVSVVIR